MVGLDKYFTDRLSRTGTKTRKNLGVQPGSLLLFRSFAWIIGAFARQGSLCLNYRGLEEREFGDGTGPQFKVRLNTLRTIFRIVRNPEMGCGESYMDEGWILEKGDLSGFLRMMCRNQDAASLSIPGKALRVAGKLLFRGRRNNPRKSRRNVARHYDIGNELYEGFLDEA